MELKKNLKFIQVFSITVGSMISSGIFILPAAAFALSGPSILISYLIAGLCALIGCLSMIELTTAMPKAGGVYFFTSRSLGAMVGTLSGLLMWMAIAMKAAFAIYGLASVVALYTGINFFIIGVIVTIFYTLINIKGTKEAAKLDVCLVSSILIIMIPFVIFGYPKIDMTLFKPFITTGGGFNTIFATAAFVFISFGGVMNAANVSEEMANPKRDIPRAIILAVILISILYGVILTITIGVLPAADFIKSINPIADAAKIILGTPGFIVITIAACFAFSSCANSGIMSSSRYPLALSKDNLIPKIFGRVNSKTNTPIIAIILTGILIILCLSVDLKDLVEGASTVILTSYILTDISVIILRSSKVRNYRPSFKVPLFPWLNILSIVLFISLICHMGLDAIKISAGLVSISLVVYFIYARKNSKKYALLHMFERFKNKSLTSDHLEDELKDIVQERDNIVKDDFDKVIEDAPVFDLEEQYELEDFLKFVSEKLHYLVNINKNTLFQQFSKRERESTTVLHASIAIPHIILEGKNQFVIMLVRCKKGIKFSEEFQSVNTIIVMAGTKDTRNLHLKALAAIAQIIQEKNFDKQWNEVSTTNNLRDIFLLGARRREDS